MQNKLTKKELKDIVQWDIKNWSNVLPFWEEHFDFKPNSKVLALGEREGGLSLYFAKRGCKVICSDYKPLPGSTKEIHNFYGVSDLIEYRQIDMKNIDLPGDSVDVVVFKSVLGALGNAQDQAAAISEINRVLKKGGVFLFAENLRGSALHQFLRNKYVKWAVNWRYVSGQDMVGWTKDFHSYDSKTFGVLALFGRTEKQRRFLGFFDRLITPITPVKWRYILFGSAFK